MLGLCADAAKHYDLDIYTRAKTSRWTKNSPTHWVLRWRNGTRMSLRQYMRHWNTGARP